MAIVSVADKAEAAQLLGQLCQLCRQREQRQHEQMLAAALFIPQHNADSLLVISRNADTLHRLRRLPAAASAWLMAQKGPAPSHPAPSHPAPSQLAEVG